MAESSDDEQAVDDTSENIAVLRGFPGRTKPLDGPVRGLERRRISSFSAAASPLTTGLA
jgi:hypothetical protein